MKWIAPATCDPYPPNVAVQMTVLGSGSSGNCTYLETDEARLLIDAGLSGRQIRNRLLSIGRTVENLTGIILTHEHSDHVQGLVGLAGKLNVPIYCNRLTKEAIELQLRLKLEFRLFSTGSSFDVGDTVIETFNVPHDAYDPVGFLLRTSEGNIGFLTDLGHATKLVVQRVRCANVLVLEANHDMKMLQDDLKRPWSIKQRILSRHGHLSNDAAALAAQEIASADLQHLYLGHLSGDCNRPELARHVVSEALDKIGAGHVQVTVSAQDVPCAMYVLKAPAVSREPASYVIPSRADRIFEQAELFAEETAPILRPVPIYQPRANY
jgi:phosphoribosyl 1,2-cyclic phosphodiesterase